MAELVKKESTVDQLQQMVFDNADFGEVRTVVIDGEPWFVGKDVAEFLGYTNPSKALADHVDDDDKLNNKTLSSLGQRVAGLSTSQVCMH